MPGVDRLVLPKQALLQRYAGRGCYTDCYATTVSATVSLADYVTAFYTTRIFKLERWLLGWALRCPSTDEQAASLASGAGHCFAAWRVAARNGEQLLMRDMHGNTCSWFMLTPVATGTRLYFGSAVIAIQVGADGRYSGSRAFRAALGLHKLYSRLLLSAAGKRLTRGVELLRVRS